MTNILATAISIAAQAHQSQRDSQGIPYILHPINVMMLLDEYDEELYAIAILHDVMEDTLTKSEDLRYFGMTERVITALQFLIHNKGTEYLDYIENITNNIDAIKVKMADLRHNSDITRAKRGGKKLALYSTAYGILKNKLKELEG